MVWLNRHASFAYKLDLDDCGASYRDVPTRSDPKPRIGAEPRFAFDYMPIGFVDQGYNLRDRRRLIDSTSEYDNLEETSARTSREIN